MNSETRWQGACIGHRWGLQSVCVEPVLGSCSILGINSSSLIRFHFASMWDGTSSFPPFGSGQFGPLLEAAAAPFFGHPPPAHGTQGTHAKKPAVFNRGLWVQKLDKSATLVGYVLEIPKASSLSGYSWEPAGKNRRFNHENPEQGRPTGNNAHFPVAQDTNPCQRGK